MTMVTSPAWGMPAAPMLAAVAVMLQEGQEEERRSTRGRARCPGSKKEARTPGLWGLPHGAVVVRNATPGSSQGGGARPCSRSCGAMGPQPWPQQNLLRSVWKTLCPQLLPRPEILIVHWHTSAHTPSGAWSPGSDSCPQPASASHPAPFPQLHHISGSLAVPHPAPVLCSPVPTYSALPALRVWNAGPPWGFSFPACLKPPLSRAALGKESHALSHWGQDTSQPLHRLAVWPRMSPSPSLGLKDPIRFGSSRILKVLPAPAPHNPYWAWGVRRAPDGDDLAKVELIVVDLGNEDGRHSLVECGAIHVDGGAHGQHKAGNTPVDVVVLQQALEGDGQCG